MKNFKWPTWPQYGKEEEQSILRVLRSNQLFADKEVLKFENLYSDYIGIQYSLGLGNATHGLHLALAALNVGEGDEVIVTSYSWISSASCILMQNAIPVFCDIETDSLGICPIDLEKKITNRTKAIILVHLYGYPAKIIEILEIAKKHNIPLIEDASHAHGAELNGRKLGTFGDISVFSLHQRKSLSVGDGGILCTNDIYLYNKIKKLRSFGDEELSYNFRMTEFAAVLGQIGLQKLDFQNSIRKENAILLSNFLIDNKSIKIRLGNFNEKVVYYAILIELIDDFIDIDQRILELQNLGIPIRKTWEPLHKHPHFNSKVNPARGLPWKSSTYQGQMKGVIYKDLYLPIVNKYCPNKILELYVHPPTGKIEIEYAAININKFLSK